MMNIIHKFILKPGTTKLSLCKKAKVLYVAEQNRELTIWVLLNLQAPKKEITFTARGTGNQFSTMDKYIGSAQVGPFVWHVFQEED